MPTDLFTTLPLRSPPQALKKTKSTAVSRWPDLPASRDVSLVRHRVERWTLSFVVQQARRTETIPSVPTRHPPMKTFSSWWESRAWSCPTKPRGKFPRLNTPLPERAACGYGRHPPSGRPQRWPVSPGRASYRPTDLPRPSQRRAHRKPEKRVDTFFETGGSGLVVYSGQECVIAWLRP